MPLPILSHNFTNIPKPIPSDEPHLPHNDPSDIGHKGGVVDKDPLANDENHTPIAIVDYLWQHRDD